MKKHVFLELKNKACCGDMEAQFSLAQTILGKGGDIEEAVKWYHEAARQGHVEAQYMMGLSFIHDHNEDAAIEWFRKAAGNGHRRAQFWLAQTILDKGGDIEEAVKWLRKAAEQGFAPARVWLKKDARFRDYK